MTEYKLVVIGDSRVGKGWDHKKKYMINLQYATIILDHLKKINFLVFLLSNNRAPSLYNILRTILLPSTSPPLRTDTGIYPELCMAVHLLYSCCCNGSGESGRY